MNFDESVDRRDTYSTKWSKNSISGIAINENAEPFWIADMDFLAEPHIKRALEKIAEKGILGYPAFTDIQECASFWLKEKHQWSVDKERIVFSSGLLHALAVALSLFTKDDAKILVFSPMYRPFRVISQLGNRKLVEYDLSYRDGLFSLDRKGFREKAEISDAILFCSPHNPSGIVFTYDDLSFVLKTAKDLDIPVFSDEIHADLSHKKRHYPLGMVNEEINASVITVFAPSKTFNIAGEHSAFAVFSEIEKEEIFKRNEKDLFLSEPGYVIGCLLREAYLFGLEYNKALVSYLSSTLESMREALSGTALKIANSDASFVTFIDCSEYYEKIEKYVYSHKDKFKGGDEGGLLSHFFGVEASVALNDGTWFGSQWKDFVRFNYGTSRKRCLAAIERMKKSLLVL